MTLKEQIRGDSFMALPTWLAKRNDVSPSEKLVYQFLLDSIGDKDCGWWGPTAIGKALDLGYETVRRNMKSLAKKGFIEIYDRGHDKEGKQNSNGYKLIWPAPPISLNPHQNEMGTPFRLMGVSVQNEMGTPFRLIHKPRKKTKEWNQGTLIKELSPRELAANSQIDSNTCSNSGNQH